MNRVKDINGTVHFAGSGACALCSAFDKNLRGEAIAMKETDAPVDCSECTRLWFECKNSKFGEVEDAAYQEHLDRMTDDFFKEYGNDSSIFGECREAAPGGSTVEETATVCGSPSGAAVMKYMVDGIV